MSNQDLGTWLVRMGEMTAERLEEVYQHQVIYGGSLDTSILEMSLLSEEVLLNRYGEFLNLPVATREDLLTSDPERLKMFPGRLVQKYAMVPFRADGRILDVALCTPRDPEVLDDIGFMLAVELRPHAALEVRLAQAMLRLHGFPLSARHEHLLAQLGEDAEEDRRWFETRRTLVPAHPVVATEEPPRETWVAHEPARGPQPLAPLPQSGPSIEPPVEEEIPPGMTLTLPPTDVVADQSAALGGLLSNHVDALSIDADLPPVCAPLPDSAPVPQLPPLPAVSDERDSTARIQRRRDRVTWNLADARAEFALATTRDDVVEVLLRFAYKTLDFAAVFIWNGEQFIGWDSIGEGQIPRALQRVKVPLVEGTALSLIQQTNSHYLGPLKPEDPLPTSVARQRPRVALLVPFFVKNRLVGVLFGERGERTIPPRAVAELQALTPDLGRTLESLILRQKRVRMGFVDERKSTISGIRDLLAEPNRRRRKGAAATSDSVPPPPMAPLVSLSEQGLDSLAPPADTNALPDAAAADAEETQPAPRQFELFEQDITEEVPREKAPPPAGGLVLPPLQERAAAVDVVLDAVPADWGSWTPVSPAHVERAKPPPLPRRQRTVQLNPIPEPVHIERATVGPPPHRELGGEPPPVTTGVEEEPGGAPQQSDRADTEPSLPVATVGAEAVVPVETPSAVDPAEASARHAAELLREAEHAGAAQLQRLSEAMIRIPRERSIDVLVERACGRGRDANSALESLVAERAIATAHALRVFPGQLLANVFGDDGPRPDLQEVSPLGRLLVRLGGAACALAVANGAQHGRREARFLAVMLARETRVPGVAELVAGRIFDPELRIGELAASTLDHMLLLRDDRSAAARQSLAVLRRALEEGSTEEKRAALRGAATVHDASLVAPLIEVLILDRKNEELVAGAVSALKEITKQDFADSPRKWRKWFKENAGRRRVEWLMDALGHKDRDVRLGAHRELNQLTGEYLGYYFDAPPKERETAIQRWRQWWESNKQRADLP